MAMNAPKHNYHTHTERCKHATGTVLQFAEAAQQRHMSVLGMTDHTPLPKGTFAHVRMRMEELDPYLADIDRARETIKDLTILKGLECDWHEDFKAFYEDELIGKRHIDYLIGAVHWAPFRGEWMDMDQVDSPLRLMAYVNHFIQGMASGLFAFMAHPDIFGLTARLSEADMQSAARDIADAATTLSMPLEINGLGLRKRRVKTPHGLRSPYPLPAFWEQAARHPITVVCNSDAHQPDDVDASIDETRAFAGQCHLRELTLDEFLKRVRR